MTKYVTLAFALTLAATSYTYAQSTPPGTDRPSGESSGQSAKPNPDKKTGAGGATTAPKSGATQTPPGTDRSGGETSTQSADPKKK
jgi:hypothetical protein